VKGLLKEKREKRTKKKGFEHLNKLVDLIEFQTSVFCSPSSHRKKWLRFSVFYAIMSDKEKQDLNELIRKYDDFITLKLKPSLKKEIDQRDSIFNTMAE
jgi:hypothetical protein